MTDSQQIDDEMERDIERLNLTAPRVTPDQIEVLMAGVTYDVHVVPGTTTTLATATAANGLTRATGMTACASPSDNRSFSAALVAVKQGKAIRRSGWNGSGLVVKAQIPDEHSKMTLPYLYIEYPADAKTTPGARCPWLASQTDIMADDWVIID